MNPPYDITDNILKLIASISEKIGAINATHLQKVPATLRKANRIRTIQSSLEIEGNTLSEEQVTAILNNKRVLAPQKDILEVMNAIKLYDSLPEFKSASLPSFLKAHRILMSGLVTSAGQLRSKEVGIVKGSQITHLAPRGTMVKSLVNDLFAYLKKSKELALIKSCVFHYEIEFIHPFIDGNGRMGRFWQTVILKEQYPVFEFLPVEHIVKSRQADYYKALGIADKTGKSTVFIEFMLSVIEEALDELSEVKPAKLTINDRIAGFQRIIGDTAFTRKDYMKQYPELSAATASRDLKAAVDEGILKKQGEKATATYKFT
ncbi:Fic family protein [Chitinophaga oryzae]|uniref:Fic family protein n=1 Tax=Chitinophaga oryzae TaxID=2725414 RepID=A0AAE7D8Q4_9BACT|nr:Fic family protein [Chitinophaga oryzae]QJB33497.1 Fic family protein [Chitinophaga oryzae]QJB40017.1 Fic family protein [Chitinophaga oryzae]